MESRRAFSLLVVFLLGAGIVLLALLGSGGSRPSSPPPVPAPEPPDSSIISPARPAMSLRADPSPPSSRADPRFASISGTVLLADSEDPVPGAAVEVSSAGHSATARTGADGTFRLEGLPPGGAIFLVETGELLDPPPRRLTLKAGGNLELDVRLVRGASLTGRAFDSETAEGIGGASVALFGHAGKAVRTDEAGSFVLRGVATGESVLIGRAPGYPPVRVLARVLPGTRITEVEIPLRRPATVRGRVTDSKGRPVAGAAVGIYGRPEVSAVTGPDGRYVLREVPAEEAVVLTVEMDGFVLARSEPVLAATGGEIAGQRFALIRGAEVHGRVLLSDGRPAIGATIRHFPGGPARRTSHLPPVAADSEGRFVFRSLGPGNHSFEAVHADGLPARAKIRSLRAGEVREGIEIRLPEAMRISGVVRDAAGHPRPGYLVAARPAGSESGDRYARVDENGRFALTGLPPGAWELRARWLHGGESTTGPVARAQEGEVSIVVPDPGILTGRVTTDDNRPVTVFTLALGDTEGGVEELVFERVSSPDGRLRVSGVAPGSYQVRVETPDGLVGAATGVVVASGEVTREISLPVALPPGPEGDPR